MFSGIIRHTGRISKIKESGGKHFTITNQQISKSLKEGDSIAINGACHTITGLTGDAFTVYSSRETLSRSNLDLLSEDKSVNLELPLTLTDYIHGHLVQGHIDYTAQISKIEKSSEEWQMHITQVEAYKQYIIEKGSITIDGVSLTINDFCEESIRITLIPSTYRKTIFQHAKAGDLINIEIDLIAKYCTSLLKKQKN